MGTLDGLLVVSLEQAVAAPFVSSRLADAGARVIKIERPEGCRRSIAMDSFPLFSHTKYAEYPFTTSS